MPAWLPERVRRRLISRVRSSGGRLLHSTKFSKGERATLRHRKKIPVSVWSERHRVVHNSSIPGRWSNEITPYLAGVMDASMFPGVQDITLSKGPQTGGTEAIHNVVGYIADRSPAPTMYVFPSENTARENMTDRIYPMYTASSRLRGLLTGKSEDKGSIRLKLRNMHVYMAWSGSRTALSNKPICYLVMDELDKYQDSKKEASSEALALKRTETYPRKRKRWRISSPSDSGSAIQRNFDQAQGRFDYVVRCRHCGMEQVMRFEQIKWDGGTDANSQEIMAQHLAWYECEHCGTCWTDIDRDEAVKLGHWRERTSGLELFAYLQTVKPRSIAFHIPGWLSRFVSLSAIAGEFIAYKQAQKKGDPEWRNMRKDFYNARLALPWVDYEEERTKSAILALCDDRPRGRVPGVDKDGKPRVAALIAGVDTQGNEEKGHYKYVIRAFGYGESGESWKVQSGAVTSIEAMEKILWGSTYKDAQGNEHVVRFVMWDAMGHQTKRIYELASKHRTRMLPTQGKQKLDAPLQQTVIEYFPGTKIRVPGGVRLTKVNTKFFKDDLSAKLAIAPGDPGCFWLHAAPQTDDGSTILDSYAAEMTAEYYDFKLRKWIQPENKKNDYWDCEVLCLAGAWHIGVSNWKRPVETAQKQQSTPVAPKRPTAAPAQAAGVGMRPAWFSR